MEHNANPPEVSLMALNLPTTQTGMVYFLSEVMARQNVCAK